MHISERVGQEAAGVVHVGRVVGSQGHGML